MKSARNIPASVRQRLLNRAKTDRRPFNELLQYYVMERFLYRFSLSPHADRFVLKGALMHRVRQGIKTMDKKIVLISCVSKKLQHQAKAKDLYINTLFKFNLKYTKSLKPDAIYILSAKHGFLNMEQEIEPYEQTLNTIPVYEIKEWAHGVLLQLVEVASLDKTEFIFLAGGKYRKYLLPYIKNTQIPLKGLGIGNQLQRLKELTT
jgi:hypothetical protein